MRYPIPAGTHRTSDVIERSRFIATVAPAPTVEEAQAFVERVRAEFADATHNCWAYVVGPPGSTARAGMSDDGEPHGTAGRPMLTMLLHGGMGDVAAVVTRYYGGVKLGTGGLVRAYGGCLQRALVGAPRAERVERVRVRVRVDYEAVAAVQQLLLVHEAEVVAQEWAGDAVFEVRLPEGSVERLRAAVLDATRGRGEVRLAGA